MYANLICVFLILQYNIYKACKLTKPNKWNSRNKYMLLWKKDINSVFNLMTKHGIQETNWKMDNRNIFIFSKNSMLCNLWNCELSNKRKYYKTLINKYKDVHNQHNTYTPYAIANVIMANYTLFDDKKIMSFKFK
jgi:hypothetical protein